MSGPTIERAARYADGWHGISADPAEIAAAREELFRIAREHGRDPSKLSTSTSMYMADDPVEAAEEVLAVAQRGLNHVILSAWWRNTVAETCSRLEAFAEAVLPALSRAS